jgi:hypothetical protein
LKNIVFLFITIFLTGCISTNQKVVYEEYKATKQVKYTKKVDTKKQVTVKKEIKEQKIFIPKSGIIKGVVKKINFDTKYRYEIRGKDISNGKLPYAVVFSNKKLFSLNDEVYVIFENLKIKEFYMLKKANKIKKQKIKKAKKVFRSKQIVKKEPKKDIIKGKKHQILAVPTSESIELD